MRRFASVSQQHPLKLGLKHYEILISKSRADGQSATSIKIRIETKPLSLTAKIKLCVSQQHPLKLGLKPNLTMGEQNESWESVSNIH